MKALSPLILLALWSCDCGGDPLFQLPDPECGQPCFVDGYGWVPAEQRLFNGIGLCTPGILQCDGDKRVCVGATDPITEKCDGLDNDCDGQIDDLVFRQCASECGTGREYCTNGTWGECSARQPTEEICDGEDDDCDGEVDEQEDLPVEFCYSGPDETAGLGICHPGVLSCVDGARVCKNDQTPEPEVCDGIDNDCDGSIDDGLGGDDDNVDIVIIVDNSGSMSRYLNAVAQSSIGWITAYQNRPALRFGLVTAPDDNSDYGETVRLFQDLTDPATLAQALGFQTGLYGSGLEPTLDAIMDVANPNTDFLTNIYDQTYAKITWRPGSRRVAILFTDEYPQSYKSPTLDVPTVAYSARDQGLTVHIFTEPGFISNEWYPITDETGGWLMDLGPARFMQQDLEDLIENAACIH